MFQQITILGRLGSDPETNHLQGGRTVCNFSVAVNRRDRDGQEQTTWFRTGVWGKQADACQKYLAKGNVVLIVGAVYANTYTGPDGATVAGLNLIAHQVKFLPRSRQPDTQGGYQDARPADHDQPYQSYSQAQEDAGVDIPF